MIIFVKLDTNNISGVLLIFLPIQVHQLYGNQRKLLDHSTILLIFMNLETHKISYKTEII
jgi:hypothetical protein